MDRSATPALPPRDTDLWVISAEALAPPPALIRLWPRWGPCPSCCCCSPTAPHGRRRPWPLGRPGQRPLGPAAGDPPQPGLRRPRRTGRAPSRASQALGLGPGGLLRRHAGGAGQGPGRRGHAGHGAAHGRERHRQGGHRPGHPPPERRSRPALRARALRGHPREPASRASSSATTRAPSPTPARTRPASSGRPTAARSSWTK